MGEAVLFIFLKDNKILIEHRLTESGNFDETMIPGGGIEDFDRGNEEDYRIKAMKREIGEELGAHIVVKDFSFLTTAESSEKAIMFHAYVIHDWDGDMPEYSLEEGQRNARLEWKKIDEAFMVVHNDVARTVVGKAIVALRDGLFSDA